ncbi:MAG: TAT-variant-translocated molybdopterin oxidoreductase [Fimbriimonadaceae bacterium]
MEALERIPDPEPGQSLDLEAIEARLRAKTEKTYWRSLEEIAETPEFQKFVDDEFPNRSSIADIDRRSFIKFMGASLALAGVGSLSGCRSLIMPRQTIVPYVKAPEQAPGIPAYFASAYSRGGYATGVVVKSLDGRPGKIEGNPEHPASLGATDTFTQSALLTMYDPDRSQNVMDGTLIADWDEFYKAARAQLAEAERDGGAGVRILTGEVSSPVFLDVLRKFMAKYPRAQWVTWEPAGRQNAADGAALAFGYDVETNYHFDKADVVLSLDADFFQGMPGSVRYTRDFMSRRKVDGKHAELNRLYAVETAPNLAGAFADHRIAVKPSDFEAYVRSLAGALGVPNVPGAGSKTLPWQAQLVRDLQAHRGRCLVVAGEWQSPAVHALVHAMNAALGNVGETVVYREPVAPNRTRQIENFRRLTEEMSGGLVKTLFILGGNPVYSAPADIDFKAALANVPFSVHSDLYANETAALCTWHVPEAHFLESWGDARAFDGTISIVQPLIEPLYAGRPLYSTLAGTFDKPIPDQQRVKEFYGASHMRAQGDNAWNEALASGMIANSSLPTMVPELRGDMNLPPMRGGGGVEVIFQPDPTIWDGQFANNGWLQELPKPLTTITWDNTVQMSPADAQAMGLANESRVRVEVNGASVEMGVWPMPGHPDGCITIHLGFGRTKAGRIGDGIGVDPQPLRTSATLWSASNATLTKLGGRYPIAAAQMHHSMEGRDIVRSGTLEDFEHHPDLAPPGAHHGDKEAPSLYPKNVWGYEYEGYQWAMTVDLNLCTGCGACVTACQAENNIPVVGKDQVHNGREMHWLRVDRYYSSAASDDRPLANVTTHHQPILCMHCEMAPCEPVCPVAATVHSHEGLNQMVYNRCVGTRYCSNNCPYKVRRFNYFGYTMGIRNFDQPGDMPLFRMLNNPDVTVRSRGVMEKCTYCVQRINSARITAKKEGRRIEDGEVVTACQQACPANVFVFGDITDPESKVSKSKKDLRNYLLLEELNTKPRTTYLGRIYNPNPEIKS